MLSPRRVTGLGAVDLLGQDDEMLAQLIRTCSMLQECAQGAPKEHRKAVFARFAALLWEVRSHASAAVRRTVVGGFASCMIAAVSMGLVASTSSGHKGMPGSDSTVAVLGAVYEWAVHVAKRDRDEACRVAARELAASQTLRQCAEITRQAASMGGSLGVGLGGLSALGAANGSQGLLGAPVARLLASM